MTPTVFLSILCLGVALAAPAPDYNLDAEWEEWKRSNDRTYSPVGHIDTQRVPFERFSLIMSFHGYNSSLRCHIYLW
jgi:hypothetical protein